MGEVLLVRSWAVPSVVTARGELLKRIQEKPQWPLYTEHLLVPDSLHILSSFISPSPVGDRCFHLPSLAGGSVEAQRLSALSKVMQLVIVALGLEDHWTPS